jgi:hypothetical protein
MRKSGLLRRDIAGVSGENIAILVDKNRIGESKLVEIFPQKRDLPIWMLLRIP